MLHNPGYFLLAGLCGLLTYSNDDLWNIKSTCNISINDDVAICVDILGLNSQYTKGYRRRGCRSGVKRRERRNLRIQRLTRQLHHEFLHHDDVSQIPVLATWRGETRSKSNRYTLS